MRLNAFLFVTGLTLVIMAFLGSLAMANENRQYLIDNCGLDFGPNRKGDQRCITAYQHECWNKTDFSPQDPLCEQVSREAICPEPDFSPSLPWCVNDED